MLGRKKHEIGEELEDTIPSFSISFVINDSFGEPLLAYCGLENTDELSSKRVDRGRNTYSIMNSRIDYYDRR